MLQDLGRRKGAVLDRDPPGYKWNSSLTGILRYINGFSLTFKVFLCDQDPLVYKWFEREEDCKACRLEVGVEKENCHIAEKVTGSAFCNVGTGRVKVRMEKEKMDLGKLVTEKEMCCLIRNIAEESCRVSLFVGKFCLSAPSPLPVVFLKCLW